jgi:unspecific monooxygenase
MTINGPPLPPGPSADIEGQDWDRHPLAAIEDAVGRFGDVFTLHRPDKPARIMVGAPEVIRPVFVGHENDLEVQGSTLFRPLVGEHSLGHLNGAAHRLHRKILTPPIHGKLLRPGGRLIQQIALETITRHLRTGPVRFRHITPEISLRVVIAYCFGPLQEGRIEALMSAFDAIFRYLRESAISSEDGREQFRHLRQRLDVVVEAEISRCCSTPERDRPTSILDHLLAAGDGPNGDFPTGAVRDEIVTMMLAGQESTPTALVHTIYWANRHPRVRRRLLDELGEHYCSDRPEDVGGLAYLDAVCAETLRLTSVVPAGITRRIRNDFHEQGRNFPAGTEVVPCIHAIHRRPDLYPNPDSFDPGRFLDRSFGGSEYLPFGVGARHCLGAALAVFEIKVVVATIMTQPTIRIVLHGDGQPDAQTIGPALTPPDSVELCRNDGHSHA